MACRLNSEDNSLFHTRYTHKTKEIVNNTWLIYIIRSLNNENIHIRNEEPLIFIGFWRMPRELSSLKDQLSFDSILNWLKFKYEMWIGLGRPNGIFGD